MNNSSVPQSLPLDKLLLDGDTDPELAVYLRAVGYDVAFVPRGGSTIRDDVEVLRMARRQGRILVCHDAHRDTATQLRLYPELYHRGGKILQIRGDSSQDLLTALGKVITWRLEWSNWFSQSDGRVIVSKGNWRKKTAAELANIVSVQRVQDIGPVVTKRPQRTTRRRTKSPPEQQPLLENKQ